MINACTLPMLINNSVISGDRFSGCDSHPALRFAAAELQRYLQRIFGAATAGGNAEATGDGIWNLGLFGESRVREVMTRAGCTIEPLGSPDSDTYLILVTHDGVHLYGSRPRAVLYAVYDFLRDCCGCEFAISATGVEHIPRLQELTLQPTQRLERAAFPVRGFGFHTETCADAAFYVRMTDWLAKLRYNRIQLNIRLWPAVAEVLAPAMAARDLDLDLGIHSLNYFLPADEHFASHPDWYASVTNRFGRQLRFSNLDSVPVVAERILAFLKQTPGLKVLGLWPLDGTGFDPAEIASGKMGDIVLRYVNAVTERLAPHYPELVIDHLAYVGYVSPPQETRPHPAVLTSVCHYWDQLFTQPVCDAWYGRARIASEDAKAKARDRFNPLRTHRECCQDLAGWLKLGPAIVFSYYTDFNLSASTVGDISRVIQTDLQYYRALGAQGSVACYCLNQEFLWLFREVHALGECLWNPDVDWAGRNRRLLDTVFGAAGDAMCRVYAALDSLHNQPLFSGFRLADLARGIVPTYAFTGYNTDLHQAVLGQIDTRMQGVMAHLAAAAAVASDPAVSERVAGIRLNLVMQQAFAHLGCHVLAAFSYREQGKQPGADPAACEAKALTMLDAALRIFNAWVADYEREAPAWANLAGKIKAYRAALEKDFREMSPPF